MPGVVAFERKDEIVIVRALDGEDSRRLTEPVERAQRELAGAGVRLAIGISTALDTTAGLPDGYREACAAIESIAPGGGVMALADLSAFDYLTLRSDGTVLRLLAPAVRRFVEEDTAGAAHSRPPCWPTRRPTSTRRSRRSVSTFMSTPPTTGSPGSRRGPDGTCATWPTCRSC